MEQALRALSVHVESTEDERLVAQVTAIVAGIRAVRARTGSASPASRTAAATSMGSPTATWTSLRNAWRTR